MFVYADNAATTSVSRTALDAMLPWLTEKYGNPSSLYGFGQEAREAVEKARQAVASCLGASTREIYFTSCGTESDNQALNSCARLGARKGKKHIISTRFEHHAILHTLKKLEKEGLLEKSRSPEDERVVLITLTDTGRALQERAKEIPGKVGSCVRLTPGKALTLYQLLYELLDEA